MQEFTGKEYLLIDIANQYGLDKLTWEKRIAWVHKNEGQLRALALTAKHPILYRKAVRALGVVKAGRPSNHIMGLDSTASGVQLISVLTGCISSAKLTNVIPVASDGTHVDRIDGYVELANSINDALPEGYEQVTRKQTKPALMTHTYGSKRVPRQMFPDPLTRLMFYNVVETQLPGIALYMDTVQRLWDDEAEVYTWNMPDGHKVRIPVTSVIKNKIFVPEHRNADMNFIYSINTICPQLKGISLAANVNYCVTH
ncbi:hypothetical protein KAU11_07325 [Candidatus Babeliales bacterium]|nr:hypothetical protein [Candidatus Babeliales bacterium]